MTVGYRGSNPYDAGMFYCPYVPLQMVRAGENTFQPKIDSKQDTEWYLTHLLGSTPANGLASDEQTNTTEKLKFLTFFNRSKKVSTFKGLFFFKIPIFFMH